ncbi:MAG: M20/M25/M40 family metallo-hydrolase [Kiritimatiellae bacterium]|nr:M20/M25/M40 family metallo-hydrolase [Kiritimatiellia bacterium]
MEDSVKEEYFKLLRFESVGADPSKTDACAACAEYLSSWFGALGFTSEIVAPPDGSAPGFVFAELKSEGESRPTVLIYGHYDVQSPDPVEAWHTPPFEPVEKDGRVFCRGSQDDKGQSFALLCGMRDYISSVPADKRVNIKVVIEGQEESGSAFLMKSAPEMRRRLAADILLVCDTSAAEGLRPAIVAGLRGVGHLTLTLTGASRDLHSGVYGGIAPNAAQGMAELLASLHTPSGAIAVKDFLAGIEEPTAEELKYAEDGSPDDEAYRKDIGCEISGGEAGKSAVRRNSFEPTIEVNGMHSGYGGPGSKTVIPSSAVAKLSVRFVPGQSNVRALDALVAYLREKTPRGMKLEISEINYGAGGFRLPLASPVFRLAADVLAQMDPRGALFMWDGASIPVVSALRDASLASPLIVGWGQNGDRIHAPDESYSFRQFELARTWGYRILEALS